VVGQYVSRYHRHLAGQRTERWQVYRDAEMTEVDWATGSIYLRDPGIDRLHLILLSFKEIHNPSFPTGNQTQSFREFVDLHCRGVSNLLTLFLTSSGPNRSCSQIPFAWHERCGRVLMMGSHPSSPAIHYTGIPVIKSAWAVPVSRPADISKACICLHQPA
jgi:hypothetical protein